MCTFQLPIKDSFAPRLAYWAVKTFVQNDNQKFLDDQRPLKTNITNILAICVFIETSQPEVFDKILFKHHILNWNSNDTFVPDAITYKYISQSDRLRWKNESIIIAREDLNIFPSATENFMNFLRINPSLQNTKFVNFNAENFESQLVLHDMLSIMNSKPLNSIYIGHKPILMTLFHENLDFIDLQR